MIPRPLPYLHVVEPHEREIVREPEIEPYKYAGLIRWVLYLASAAVVGMIGWGAMS